MTHRDEDGRVIAMTAAEREQVARAALADITAAGTFGELVSDTAEADGVFTLLFAANMAGYPGWHWTVSLAELDGEQPTVLETELMPGDGALLAPDWVPWSERLDEYRAAQAEAGEPDESVVDPDDDEDDDDLSSDVLHGGDLDGVDIDEAQSDDDDSDDDDSDDDDDPDEESDVDDDDTDDEDDDLDDEGDDRTY